MQKEGQFWTQTYEPMLFDDEHDEGFDDGDVEWLEDPEDAAILEIEVALRDRPDLIAVLHDLRRDRDQLFDFATDLRKQLFDFFGE